MKDLNLLNSNNIYFADEPSLLEHINKFKEKIKLIDTSKAPTGSLDDYENAKASQWFTPKWSIDNNGIVTYPITGCLTSNEELFYYMYDYETPYSFIESDFKQFKKDNSVKGILLNLDSPGGSARGYKDAINSILDLGKPIVAHSKAWCMSMAYMFATCSNSIFASESSRIGSVGTIWQTLNMYEMLKEQGIQPITIRFGADKGKPNNWEKFDVKDYSNIANEVNEEGQKFYNFVAERRNLSLEKDAEGFVPWAEGRHFEANQAKELGLINEVGNRDSAYTHLVSLIDTGQKPALIQDSISISLTTPNNMTTELEKLKQEVEALNSSKELLTSESKAKDDKIVALEAKVLALETEKNDREEADKTNLITQIDSIKNLTASEKSIYAKCSLDELKQVHSELSANTQKVEEKAPENTNQLDTSKFFIRNSAVQHTPGSNDKASDDELKQINKQFDNALTNLSI